MKTDTNKPIPTPNQGESEEDFIERCVSFLINEGTPQEQAVAICSEQWNKPDKKKLYAERSKLMNQIIKK